MPEGSWTDSRASADLYSATVVGFFAGELPRGMLLDSVWVCGCAGAAGWHVMMTTPMISMMGLSR